jgi:hypothetical protein
MEANNVDFTELRSFKDLKKSARINLKENDMNVRKMI